MEPWTQLKPHRRRNPLTGEWVLVSPQRTNRPWQGQVETPDTPIVPAYDPTCYLCPGNSRAGGVRNPEYSSTFVFDNDFPALHPETEGEPVNVKDLLVAAPERGICRVICFSPRHDLAIPQIGEEGMAAVVNTWCDQTAELFQAPHIRHVQIFENRGQMMGASNPHPHGQIWACESVPPELLKEDAQQARYYRTHRSCLLCDYLRAERNGERLVYANASFVALVPFWAVWPFEVLIAGTSHTDRLDHLGSGDRLNLADILQQVTARYDALFGVAFPYTMGFHQCPQKTKDRSAWHLHLHFYPPLLRSATVRKFIVGFEMLSGPQRDVTPEYAASRLRGVTGSK